MFWATGRSVQWPRCRTRDERTAENIGFHLPGCASALMEGGQMISYHSVIKRFHPVLMLNVISCLLQSFICCIVYVCTCIVVDHQRWTKHWTSVTAVCDRGTFLRFTFLWEAAVASDEIWPTIHVCSNIAFIFYHLYLRRVRTLFVMELVKKKCFN